MPEFYKKQWFYILFTYWHFCVCAHFNPLLFSFTNGDSLLLYFCIVLLLLYDLNLLSKRILKTYDRYDYKGKESE